MNTPSLKDFEEKKKRIRGYMSEKGYGAAVLGRRDNFAWFTYGGDNKIFRSGDLGVGLLVITADHVYLVAQYMDADRIMDEELAGLDIEKICLKWFEQSREQKAVALADGKRVAADFFMEGAECKFDDILALHTPYTPWEIERYRAVGALNDRLYREIASAVKPGMTELEIEAIMLEVFGRENMSPKVLLVGSDGRILKYRHPNASEKKVERLLLLHAAPDKHGMHANITRMVAFGGLERETEQKYELLNRCLASACSMLVPGAAPASILEERKRILDEAGMGHEFELHYPGATTGYFVGSAQPMIANAAIADTMCYDWFITVCGAKVEELCMAREGGAEVLSASGAWPLKEYEVNGYRCRLPVILVK